MNTDGNNKSIFSKEFSRFEMIAWLMAGLSGILIVATKEINIPAMYGYMGLLIGAGLGGWLYGKKVRKLSVNYPYKRINTR